MAALSSSSVRCGIPAALASGLGSTSAVRAAARMPLASSFQGLKVVRNGKSRSVPVQRTNAIRASVATEPATKISFPVTLAAPGGTKDLSLLGTGVREKAIGPLKVKVYAVGIYADPEIQSLIKGGNVYSTIATTPCEKAIVIVLARKVGSDQFWNALNEELAPKLTAAGESLDDLNEFGKLFKEQALNKDTGIYITWKQPSTLQVAFSNNVTADGVPSSTTASFNSSGLLNALFDVYLGAEGVSPSLKESIASNAK
eukprot:TRINITY_DN9276_c0_g1_i2.p1 TRINITY_DN9276_c0_g1~~TRINITY_DN9276_c0_g1_i2.p1  ORF type:complete len:290 (-),score=27.94 TRINITY_DN9276_c0_g1_i2:143-913(-)